MSVELFTKETIDRLEWPQTAEGEFAKKYLTPLIKNGSQAFICNAETEMALLKVSDHIVPITINDTEYDNTYLLSSYFVAANLEEKVTKFSSAAQIILKPCISFFGKLLKWAKINKVVIINNWLLTTNPYPELTDEQIGEIVDFLQKHYPKHYFMFRSVGTYKSDQVYQALEHHDFRLIPCRYVYLYDPSSKHTIHAIRKQKKDFNRIARYHYEVEEVDTLSEKDLKRVLDLYRQVYIGKYTKYSPIYTPEYLRYHLKNKTLKLQLLKKEGEIMGVNGYLQKDGLQLVPFFGYDTSLPHKEGLYRMLCSLITKEVTTNGLVSHQGSGAPDFKKWRGCHEHLEYVAIYDKHLPCSRRLFWYLGKRFSSKPKPPKNP